eukprot:s1191_g17.t1
MSPLMLAVLAAVHDSDAVPSVVLLQFLAAGRFAGARGWVANVRAQCHQRYDYMVQCFERAVVDGVFCPCVNQRLQGILRMETFERPPFDHRLAQVLRRLNWAFPLCEAGGPYPVELAQRFQEYNPFPTLVAFTCLPSRHQDGHWPLAVQKRQLAMGAWRSHLLAELFADAEVVNPIKTAQDLLVFLCETSGRKTKQALPPSLRRGERFMAVRSWPSPKLAGYWLTGVQARRPEEEFRLGPSPFGEKLLRLATAGCRGDDEEEEG